MTEGLRWAATTDWRGSGRLEVEGAGPAAGLSCAHDEACSLLVAAAGPAPAVEATELLARYRAEGAGVIENLGAGVVAIVADRRSQSVIAARDATGIHPLFHSADAGRVRISPFSDALLARRERAASVDRIVVVASLLDLRGDPQRTFFEGISRVPAGCVVRIERGRTTVRRWWHPPWPTDMVDGQSFGSVLRSTVHTCAADGASGVLLSGGLDSACVAAALTAEAASGGGPMPSALSLTFPGTASDEAATQRAVATALHMPHHVMAIDAAAAPGTMMKRALALAPQTAAPPGLLQPAYDALLLAARDRGIRVVLTGDGGDEYLMPPPLYPAERLRALDLRALARLGRAWNGYWPGASPAWAARAVLWHNGLRELGMTLLRASLAAASPRLLRRFTAARVRRWEVPWLAHDRALESELVEWTAASPRPPLGGLAEGERRSLVEHPNLSVLNEQVFGMRERLGVAMRLPLLQPDVVSFCLAQPLARLIAGGRAKALARELLSGVSFSRDWPRTVYGDGVFDAIIDREGAEAWRDLGGPRLLAELGIVDAVGVERVTDTRIWDIMALEKWLQPRILGAQHEQAPYRTR